MSPELDTVAMDGLAEDHVTALFPAFEGRTVLVINCVLPSPTDTLLSDTDTEETATVIDTTHVAVNEPQRAVITGDPNPIAVMVPDAFTVAFAVLILSDVFESIPFEIEEAAFIDGASRFGTLVRIVLPLSGPGLATAGLFLFAQAWNEFTLALTVLSDPELTPLSIGLYQFYGQFDKQWTYLFATAVMGALPVILCFMYLERWLIKGLTAGSIK